MQQPEDEGRRSLSATQDEVLQAVQWIMHDLLASEGRLPTPGKASDEALDACAGLALDARGHDFEDVAKALRAVVLATPSSASPLFVNQLYAGRDPVATLAEMLTPLIKTSMYTFKVAGLPNLRFRATGSKGRSQGRTQPDVLTNLSGSGNSHHRSQRACCRSQA